MKKIDEGCDGWCTPELFIYHVRCPEHGAGALRMALEQSARPDVSPWLVCYSCDRSRIHREDWAQHQTWHRDLEATAAPER